MITEKNLAEGLYEAYYMKVYSYAMTLAKNKDSAEEIVQETFCRAMATDKKFRGESDECSWLCAIAKNLFCDEMRRRKRRSDGAVEDAESPEGESSSDVCDKDTSFRIHMILHSLDEPYREVFELRCFGELSFRQIGAIFGKTESWARVTYHRAGLKIRERMN